MAEEHKVLLDKFEGNGFGYVDKQVKIEFENKIFNCFSYFAQQEYIVNDLQPYHWYKELVVVGSRYLKFPDSYISSISAIDSCDDHDINRRMKHELLLQNIKSFTD